MRTLAIDIETYSSTDLLKSGVYKYVQDKDFDILIIAYCFDKDPISILDLESEDAKNEFCNWLTDPTILKTAYNANFERTCLSRFFNISAGPGQWSCTMAMASMLGLPLSLEQCAKALKLDQQKQASGKTLIRYFSLPCKPTASKGMRTRNLPGHDLFRWNEFKEYCIQDVAVEQAIRNKISSFKIPESEIKLWCLDQKINDTGVLIDPVFVKNAIRLSDINTERLEVEASKLTGLENPNSSSQLKGWISEETGTVISSLTKESTIELLESTGCETVSRVLEIRQEMAKTSVKKYEAMIKSICTDHRVRGLLQYYGANRTGRWAGRLIQVQNLPRIFLKDRELDLARTFVREANLEMLELIFGNVPDTLSQLIRTAFVAPAGHRFIIADFSAIEARVIAWVASEKWRMDVFNTHGKIYEASASQMFKIPLENITKDLRQKGKVAELALGYQGGPNALIKMGALKMGIPELELPKLVKMWRNANKKITQLWTDIDAAAVSAVSEGGAVTIQHNISFKVEKNILFITLPSGRSLSYLNPRVKDGKFGNQSLIYDGLNQETKQWGSQDTYGGKLVENIVQAIARDCLADAMLRIDETGYKIVMHVHDEVVLEVANGKGSIEEINKIMGAPIPWAKGLRLTAESYETNYYKKD